MAQLISLKPFHSTTQFNCQAVINADIYISAGVVGCISFRLKAFMCTDIRTKTDDIVFSDFEVQ